MIDLDETPVSLNTLELGFLLGVIDEWRQGNGDVGFVGPLRVKLLEAAAELLAETRGDCA
jgi:hypothetical protein